MLKSLPRAQSRSEFPKRQESSMLVIGKKMSDSSAQVIGMFMTSSGFVCFSVLAGQRRLAQIKVQWFQSNPGGYERSGPYSFCNIVASKPRSRSTTNVDPSILHVKQKYINNIHQKGTKTREKIYLKDDKIQHDKILKLKASEKKLVSRNDLNVTKCIKNVH